jgi:hypothetical protein
MRRRPKGPRVERPTSIAITARLGGGYRVAVFPRDPRDMSTMPQDYDSRPDADAYAARLSDRTGWHVVNRAREQGLE